MAASTSVKDPNAPWAKPEPTTKDSETPTYITAEDAGIEDRTGGAPPKDGYVFGTWSRNWGYYSLATKDAYQILIPRLRKQELVLKQRVNNYYTEQCLCMRSPNKEQLKKLDSLQYQWDTVQDLLAYATARLKAPGPYSPIQVKSVKKDGPEYVKVTPEVLSRAGGEYVYEPPEGNMIMGVTPFAS